MDQSISRQRKISRVFFYPAQTGSRAVFLAEARSRKEIRQVRELFDMVGQLAQVVPVSHGAVMSYAVQVQGDTSLFSKVEWLLKTQFTFSLVERNFTDITFHLVRSLCEDSSTQMVDLPACGICQSTDPFATRATLELADTSEPVHLAYCARCTATQAEGDPQRLARTLLKRDRRRLKVAADVPVVLMPEMVDEQTDQSIDRLAIAG
jgi:hypothetical protein